MLGMESRNSRCNCPNIWRKPYLEDVSILAPSPPIWIPLTFSILPLVYRVSPFLSFSTNSWTPQTPESWGKWLLQSAGFQNQTTDPSLFQATSSKHPELEEDSVISSGAAYEHPGWKLPCTWREPCKEVEWLMQHLGREYKEMECPSSSCWNEIHKEAKWSGKHLSSTMGVICPQEAFL